ncbi:PREDICTED: uncharacterized protein LOC104727909 [Camelina sativa]|uniref:Uncharacterized protein LOC104727909 n=1 Tax=Camelina sativa TaxID=90675 RepID=A0ABM0US00_CAMSA|nr:PREDICTED: uncharacterized protein LOC104727909 [Camelina sativa]
MSQDSDDSSDSQPPPNVETLTETLTEETEAFATKLIQNVKAFVNSTTTSRDEVRAMVRCLKICILKFNSSLGEEGLAVDNSVVQPKAKDSEGRNTDEYRENANELLRFLKNHTLEYYLTALHPLPTTATSEALRTLRVIRSEVRDCDILIDRVMFEGYDCITTIEDEEEEEEEEEDDEEDEKEDEGI